MKDVYVEHSGIMFIYNSEKHFLIPKISSNYLTLIEGGSRQILFLKFF